MLTSLKLLCQNIIDPKPLTYYPDGMSKYNSSTGFLRCWNWGSPGKKLDEALKINTYHGFDFDQTKTSDLNNIKDSIMYFQYLHDLITSRAWDLPFALQQNDAAQSERDGDRIECKHLRRDRRKGKLAEK